MPHKLARQQVRLSSTVSSAMPNLEDRAWREWQAHVDAGRIGSRPRLSFENRLTHMRNEIALFGRVVTPELERF
ncbi:MAG: hypothetical protein V2J51_12605 [Erythrobacter sp.]|jgi:hypothetical protein|nr:hypothetical protein [Erythrobacter sp.]